MTHLFILFGMKEKMAYFEPCVSSVLTQNEDIWNFHGSLTLIKGKLIWYAGSLWYGIVSNMTHFFILFWMRKRWPVVNYVFYFNWWKMKTFGIFMAHWLWIKANQFDILKAFGIPLYQKWIIFHFFRVREENCLFWTMCFTCTDTKWRHLE